MEWDFASNQEVDEDTLQKAPEGYRSAYAKGDDGKYRVADGFKPFVDAIVGLGGALKGERNVTKTLKGQKDIGEQLKSTLGFETLEEAKAKFDELNGTIATASKVDPAKIKADIEKTFDVERQQLKGEVTTMQGTLQKFMIENGAISALAEAKGNAKLLLPLIREQVELVKDGDEYVVRVKDGAGDYRGNGRGGFMSVEDLVAEMKKSTDYAAAFESDAPAGTQRTGVGQRPASPSQRQNGNQGELSANDRIAKGLQQRRGGR